MKFNEFARENRRLVVLQMLAEDADYAANEHVLRRGADAYGHSISQDTLRGDIAWLTEQGLITTDTVGSTTLVAKITARGLDVAQGRAIVPGVQRPRPE
jgi:hypothetical protein